MRTLPIGRFPMPSIESAIESGTRRQGSARDAKRRQVAASESLNLAGPTGLEPATSGVTGRRSMWRLFAAPVAARLARALSAISSIAFITSSGKCWCVPSPPALSRIRCITSSGDNGGLTAARPSSASSLTRCRTSSSVTLASPRRCCLQRGHPAIRSTTICSTLFSSRSSLSLFIATPSATMSIFESRCSAMMLKSSASPPAQRHSLAGESPASASDPHPSP